MSRCTCDACTYVPGQSCKHGYYPADQCPWRRNQHAPMGPCADEA